MKWLRISIFLCGVAICLLLLLLWLVYLLKLNVPGFVMINSIVVVVLIGITIAAISLGSYAVLITMLANGIRVRSWKQSLTAIGFMVITSWLAIMILRMIAWPR